MFLPIHWALLKMGFFAGVFRWQRWQSIVLFAYPPKMFPAHEIKICSIHLCAWRFLTFIDNHILQTKALPCGIALLCLWSWAMYAKRCQDNDATAGTKSSVNPAQQMKCWEEVIRTICAWYCRIRQRETLTLWWGYRITLIGKPWPRFTQKWWLLMKHLFTEYCCKPIINSKQEL